MVENFIEISFKYKLLFFYLFFFVHLTTIFILAFQISLLSLENYLLFLK